MQFYVREKEEGLQLRRKDPPFAGRGRTRGIPEDRGKNRKGHILLKQGKKEKELSETGKEARFGGDMASGGKLPGLSWGKKGR